MAHGGPVVCLRRCIPKNGSERLPPSRVQPCSMMKRNLWIAFLMIACLGSVFVALAQKKETEAPPTSVAPTEQDLVPVTKLEKTNAEWKTSLTPAQFAVLREK